MKTTETTTKNKHTPETSLNQWNEQFPPGTSVFSDANGKWFRTTVKSKAFIVEGEPVVRVYGIAGVIPIHWIKIAKDGEIICPTCEGSGELREAVQAWDCGQDAPSCKHCTDGIMSRGQLLASQAEAKDIALKIQAYPALLAALEAAETHLVGLYGEGGLLERGERPFALHNQIVSAISKAKGIQ